MTDKYHMLVNGEPGCLRPPDGEPLEDYARTHRVPLCCSHTDKAVLERSAAVMRDFHPDWRVEIVEGGCPASDLYGGWYGDEG